MTTLSLKKAVIAVTLVSAFPMAAFAQEDVRERAEELSEQAKDVQEQADALANDVTARDEAAQADRDTVAGTEDGVGDNVDEDDGDSGNWGLLGLLGLAGLLGLRKPTNRVHSDTSAGRRM